ncbi:MAG: ChaN family lipoprotein [Bacteroidota bacterium]
MITNREKSGKRIVTFLLLASIAINAFTQKEAYRLFRENGKKAKYEKMVEAASGADVVLFGEYHTNPISHWLQLELSQDLHEIKGADLVLGAEMFESDNQVIMDEYFTGLISEAKFEEEARLWKNYKTDYKPLVLLAKENDLKFIATNIPRRYANTVFKQGVAVLDSLSDEAKRFIAPLPLEYDTALNCYNQLIHGREEMGRPGSINMADAQAIKDATMTHFILKNWQPGKLFIHYNGAYHSDDFESMNWFLLRDNPELKIVTISTVSQENLDELEEDSMGKADYIIAVPSTMTNTHR